MWGLFTLIKRGNVYSFYCNYFNTGVTHTIGSTSPTWTVGFDNRIRFGGTYPGYDDPFDGIIKDLKFYNDEISTDQMKQDML